MRGAGAGAGADIIFKRDLARPVPFLNVQRLWYLPHLYSFAN